MALAPPPDTATPDPSAPDPAQPVRRGQERSPLHVEAAVHAALRLVGDFPGQVGRIRAARVIGGFTLDGDPDVVARLAHYWVHLDWPLRELVALVDRLVEGGLLTRTFGSRPTLVLTRAGFRALEALESGPGGAPGTGVQASIE